MLGQHNGKEKKGCFQEEKVFKEKASIVRHLAGCSQRKNTPARVFFLFVCLGRQSQTW